MKDHNHAVRSGTARLAVATVVFLAAGASFGQSTQPGPKPSEKPVNPAPPPEPTLDELLGLPKQAANPAKSGEKEPTGNATDKSGDQSQPKDAAKAELDRKLAADEMKDEFEEAVKLMDDTSKRLVTDQDAGLDTQRMQEQVLLKLDKIIDQAQKQKSKSKSKSKSKPDQQNSDSQSQPQPQSSQNQADQQQQQSKSAKGGIPNTPQQSAKLNPPPGAGAAWGSLPERLRDALMQGSGDYTSAKYRELTSEYYKRLAEQPTTSAGGGK